MSTLHPRIPYSSEEIERLYPEGLALELVQIVRSPIFCLVVRYHGMGSRFCERFDLAGAIF
jgi:hypothetical protein